MTYYKDCPFIHIFTSSLFLVEKQISNYYVQIIIPDPFFMGHNYIQLRPKSLRPICDVSI